MNGNINIGVNNHDMALRPMYIIFVHHFYYYYTSLGCIGACVVCQCEVHRFIIFQTQLLKQTIRFISSKLHTSVYNITSYRSKRMRLNDIIQNIAKTNYDTFNTFLMLKRLKLCSKYTLHHFSLYPKDIKVTFMASIPAAFPKPCMAKYIQMS